MIWKDKSLPRTWPRWRQWPWHRPRRPARWTLCTPSHYPRPRIALCPVASQSRRGGNAWACSIGTRHAWSPWGWTSPCQKYIIFSTKPINLSTKFMTFSIKPMISSNKFIVFIILKRTFPTPPSWFLMDVTTPGTHLSRRWATMSAIFCDCSGVLHLHRLRRYRTQHFWCRIQHFWCRIQHFWCRIQHFWCRIQHLKYKKSHHSESFSVRTIQHF